MSEVAAGWFFEPLPESMQIVLPVQVLRTDKPLVRSEMASLPAALPPPRSRPFRAQRCRLGGARISAASPRLNEARGAETVAPGARVGQDLIVSDDDEKRSLDLLEANHTFRATTTSR